MRILSLLIPHFPTTIERRDNPELEGRPLIITHDGHPHPSGWVMDCSPEAMDQGVKVGMTIEKAERICPEAPVLAADVTRYEWTFKGLLKVLGTVSPVVEASRWGEAHADITSPTPNLGSEGALCQEVGRSLAQEVGLKGLMGVAGNKFTSYAAACAIGWGKALLIRTGTERQFLARLPVELLPMSDEMIEDLRILGIRSIGQFAQLPAGAVLARLGPQARKAHQLARGRDRRPLIPYHSPQVLKATHQFEPPLEMNERLTHAVGELACSCCKRLRERGLSCQEVHVFLSFDGGHSHGAQRTLTGPTASPQMVEASAQEILTQLSRADRVTEAHLAVGRLQAQKGKQLKLGYTSRSSKADLSQLVRPLSTKFGADRFYGGRVLNSSSPLSELRFAWQRWEI